MIDTVRLNIRAGSGGNGCSSFLREKYRPKGGPNGGDGGDGGSAYLVGDASYNTLLHIKFNSTVYCESGGHGKGKNKRGPNGKDTYIPVPIGTVVWRMNRDGSRDLLTDIHGNTPFLVGRGGRGGWGNSRFATSTNQEPVLSERGEKGDAAVLFLELKLLADVGLLARPNAGKSTLISRCSAAKAKVADYPFTTVEPVLGVVRSGHGKQDRDFVMMEIPGLLEGAHKGVGLGHQFLRHAERARLYVHLIDGLSEDPAADYRMVHDELLRFNPELAGKRQMVVVNKLDVTEVREQESEIAAGLKAVSREFEEGTSGDPGDVMFISAVTGEGIDAMLARIAGILEGMPKDDPSDDGIAVASATPPRQSRLPESVQVEDGVFVIESERLERLSALADTRDQRVLLQLWREMRRSGLAHRLVEEGIEVGDTIRIGEVEVEWF
jgi:GTP-binding protein